MTDFGNTGTLAWPWATNKSGGRLSNLENVTVAFECDAELQSVAWYDSFLQRILTRGDDGHVRQWTAEDDTRIAIRLQRDHALKAVSADNVRAVVIQRARAFPRHCVREWLESLTWDGVERCATAFEDYWGCEPTADQPQDHIRAASRNFLYGMVARAIRPGCQLDAMPVFEGPQGIFKSKALRVLAGPDWHMTANESVEKKDFLQSFQGKWLVEIAELDAFSRADVTRIKSIMSTPIDRYRVSYGKDTLDFPRQCVFAGTTNADAWGRDESGLRRFWPVTCGTIRIDLLEQARPHLFAEAFAAVSSGATWWEMPESTKAVQAARQHEAAITEAILPWLLGKSETTILDVCQGPLKLDAGRVSKTHEMEVARVLRLHGWVKRNLRRDGQQRKVWCAPGDEPVVAADEPVESDSRW